tara:strand:- start:158 stop:586 length:429 start_codon:yes stop_codon:yes gene_type:complete
MFDVGSSNSFNTNILEKLNKYKMDKIEKTFMGCDYDEKGNLIPIMDPQTGELNPYYEELTGKPNPLSSVKIINTSQKDERLKIFPDYLKDIQKMPDQKWHQIISFIKSGIRIIGYCFIPFNLVIAAIILVISEVIGIVEELV